MGLIPEGGFLFEAKVQFFILFILLGKSVKNKFLFSMTA
jgi:hypothetical protein